MSATEILDGLGFWLGRLGEVAWVLLAWTLDSLHRLDAVKTGGLVLLLSAIAVTQAMGLQKRLVAAIASHPTSSASLWKLDWRSALPVAIFLPFVWLFRAAKAVFLWVWRRITKEEKAEEATPPATPYTVATLGPSYLVAAAILAVVFVLGRITEPLLAAQLELSPGAPAWQVLFLGHRPELRFHLPLEHRPFAGGVVLLFYWLTLWTWIGRLVRRVWQDDLGRNLFRDRINPAILPSWRESFAARTLVAPADAYRDWAQWLVAPAAPLLVWAWFSLGNEVYRVPPSLFAVAWIVWLSWFLHLRLRGVEKLDGASEETTRAAAHRGPGWEEVLADLRERLQVGEPVAAAFPRRLARLDARHDPRKENLFSPLLAEVTEGLPGLTTMQLEVLQRLARDGHVHTEVPLVPGELTLGSRLESHDREDVERRRNRIVLAPEGAGKTTLAVLAACNHALVHTRSTILVVRGEDQAKALYESFRNRLDRSTVRWNLRVRRIDEDLANDLTRGILPDVVITDLRGLVVPLLDSVDHYRDFLRTVGLIVVDDAESFAGPVEIHAQLALRRLKLVFRELLGVEQLGEETAPMFLVLGADAMHQTATWVKDLCGIEAEVLPYVGRRVREEDKRSDAGNSTPEKETQEASGKKKAAPGQESEIKAGRHHRFYRIVDFATPYGEPIDLRDVVESCERVGVSWHYRRCGDDRRHLGLESLNLPERPGCFSTSARAGVVILEGQWSEVWREIGRLRHAGCDFNRIEEEAGRTSDDDEGTDRPESIAFLTVIDPDEDMALTFRDRHAEIFRLIDELPHPVLRPPTGRVIQSHLATDLTQRWIEVKDLIDVFGHDIRNCLRQLAHQDLLLAEERVDVRRFAFEYQNKLFVRALARSVVDDENEDEGALLPPKVAQVELTSKRLVRLVDRTTQIPLRTVDADSANLAFYPGRLFNGENERYVVVGPGKKKDEEDPSRDDEKRRDVGVQNDLFVEPTLVPDRSSPRRRIRRVSKESELGPDPVHIGSLPLQVELARVELRTEHYATLRVDPVDGTVRQRHVYEEESRQYCAETRLSTTALMIYPNPKLTKTQLAGHEPHPLHLEAARLIAAAMRLVLPSAYRGAREDLSVEIHAEGEGKDNSHVLKPDEGFLLFDLHDEGNGTARAIHRDGIELLLRLVRLVLERVLSLARLRALYDHWGDPAELHAVEEASRGNEVKRREQRQADQALRHDALTWLDQHLRPEGGPASLRSDDDYGSGCEEGEGDFFDLGRCWYSSTGSVAHLVWGKHRWRLANQDEAALDVAFDRRTVEESRLFTENPRILRAYAQLYQRHLADESAQLEDGTARGAPRPVWSIGADDKPRSSGDPAGQDAVTEYHRLVSAVAAHFRPTLAGLAHKLADQSAKESGSSPLAVATYVARFVQGIPYSVPVALGWGLRPPVSTLLFHRGDCDSKSLLMALLLEHCGIDSGIFVSFSERHAMVAAAISPSAPVTHQAVTVHRDEEGKFATKEDAVSEEHYFRGRKAAEHEWSHLQAWCEQTGLPLPPMWADLPSSEEGSDGMQLFVPIESTVYSPVNGARISAPESWCFLPLLLHDYVRWSDDPVATDTAEYGETSK